jgi:hypothetical protein
MKRIGLIAALTVLSLTACQQGLNDKDRAMLKETRELAQQAKDAADRAEANSKVNAAASTQAADKADRIFRAGQHK